MPRPQPVRTPHIGATARTAPALTFPLTFPLPIVLTALLAACGGGGGGTPAAGNPGAAVSSASAAAAGYSQTLQITVNGSNLDQGISGASAGCKNIVPGRSGPNVSTATTAYFTCTVSAVGAQQFRVLRNSDAATLTTVAYTVAQPQVTLAVSNGAAVVGNVVLTLDPARAPVTVDNFLAYVSAGFYTDTVFHRLVPNFILQGGGYAGPLVANGPQPTLKTTQPAIVLEDNAGLSNLRYTLAMARTGVPDSATSQFFINLVDNNGTLDRTPGARGYAVFGSVTGGIDVITASQAAPCTSWPAFLDSGACLLSPNLTISSAAQTR